MKRPSIDDRMLGTAMVQARGSTCARRAVGCVITDEYNHILATGYNGNPKGFPHCNEQSYDLSSSVLDEHTRKLYCPGRNAPTGTDLNNCLAIHAEANALLQCPDVMRAATLYTTTQPCRSCMLLIANTGIRKVVYLDSYPDEIRDAIAAAAYVTMIQRSDILVLRDLEWPDIDPTGHGVDFKKFEP